MALQPHEQHGILDGTGGECGSLAGTEDAMSLQRGKEGGHTRLPGTRPRVVDAVGQGTARRQPGVAHPGVAVVQHDRGTPIGMRAALLDVGEVSDIPAGAEVEHTHGVRVKHRLNPKLAVWVEGEWRHIYDLLSLDALGFRRRVMHAFYSFDPKQFLQRDLQQFKTVVARLRSAP